MRISRRTAFTLIELLVVIAIISTLIGLLLPAVQKVRESAYKGQCLNNMKQIGLAMNLYHEAHDAFPTASTTSSASAFTQILPFIEQDNIRKAYNIDLSPTVAPNDALAKLSIRIFICPTMRKPTAPADAYTTHYASYAASIGSKYAWGPATEDDGVLVRYQTSSGISHGGISDGASSTFLVGEMGFQLQDYTFTRGAYAGQVRGGNTSWALGYASYAFGSTLRPLNTETFGPSLQAGGLHAFRSDHIGGGNFLFADGSVRFVRDSITPHNYQGLSTRAGGEIVSD